MTFCSTSSKWYGLPRVSGAKMWCLTANTERSVVTFQTVCARVSESGSIFAMLCLGNLSRNKRLMISVMGVQGVFSFARLDELGGFYNAIAQDAERIP